MKYSAFLLLSVSLLAAANPYSLDKEALARSCLRICAGPEYECPEGYTLEKIGVSVIGFQQVAVVCANILCFRNAGLVAIRNSPKRYRSAGYSFDGGTVGVKKLGIGAEGPICSLVYSIIVNTYSVPTDDCA
jgi:hypothetical protein